MTKLELVKFVILKSAVLKRYWNQFVLYRLKYDLSTG